MLLLKRWRFISILAALVLALWWLWPATLPVPPPTQTPADAAAEARAAFVTQRLGPAAPPKEPPQPIIDAITVEKEEVCEGEPNLISVTAHMPNRADDAKLHYLISGAPGQANDVVTDLERLTVDVPNQVIVFGDEGSVAVREIPRYRVKPCKPAHTLALRSVELADTPGVLAFYARVINYATPTPMRAPITYRWTFGDEGDPVATREPTLTRDFAFRPQKTQFSHFLVTCEATASDGEKVVAHLGVELRNDAYDMQQRLGVVFINARLSPPETEWSPDGLVAKQVRLFHAHDAPVVIDRVVAEMTAGDYSGERGARGPSPVTEETLDVARDLGVSRVVPGADGARARVVFDTRAREGVLVMTYRLFGHSEDGLPAEGRFSVFRPRPTLSKENGIRITDELTSLKVQIAQHRLNKKEVSGQDLLALDAEGVFDGLEQALAKAKGRARASGQPRLESEPRTNKPEGNALPAPEMK